MKKILSISFLLVNVFLYSQSNTEILEINEVREFENAINSSTVNSLDNFITAHPNGKLKEKATQIRDSLALPKQVAGFSFKCSEYIEKYPSSKYSLSMKKSLPEIMYMDAKLQPSFRPTVELYKLIISTYPNAPIIYQVKKDMEKCYIYTLNQNFDTDVYKEYKSFYPESAYYLDKKAKKILPRSDGKYSIAAP